MGWGRRVRLARAIPPSFLLSSSFSRSFCLSVSSAWDGGGGGEAPYSTPSILSSASLSPPGEKTATRKWRVRGGGGHCDDTPCYPSPFRQTKSDRILLQRSEKEMSSAKKRRWKGKNPFFSDGTCTYEAASAMHWSKSCKNSILSFSTSPPAGAFKHRPGRAKLLWVTIEKWRRRDGWRQRKGRKNVSTVAVVTAAAAAATPAAKKLSRWGGKRAPGRETVMCTFSIRTGGRRWSVQRAISHRRYGEVGPTVVEPPAMHKTAGSCRLG